SKRMCKYEQEKFKEDKPDSEELLLTDSLKNSEVMNVQSTSLSTITIHSDKGKTSFIETDNENENERNETQLVADEEDSDNNYQATITQEK
ncbi:unnamed protein product, partial [Didymodactylos carnosus]